LVSALDARADSITLNSNTTWGVYNADPALGPATLLGNAEAVCLNASFPSSCPAGATFYGWPAAGGWAADLTTIPNASWIWAPGVMGTTSPAELAQYYFSQTFNLSGIPIAGSLSLAVDDFANVFVNGVSDGTEGSITDFGLAAGAQNVLHTMDITSFLVQGNNTLTIFAQNGPASFAGCVEPCNYANDPAGVVFGATIEEQPAPVPEPSMLILVGSGLGAGLMRIRRGR
jgi:hypothetical protein